MGRVTGYRSLIIFFVLFSMLEDVHHKLAGWLAGCR